MLPFLLCPCSNNSRHNKDLMMAEDAVDSALDLYRSRWDRCSTLVGWEGFYNRSVVHVLNVLSSHAQSAAAKTRE